MSTIDMDEELLNIQEKLYVIDIDTYYLSQDKMIPNLRKEIIKFDKLDYVIVPSDYGHILLSNNKFIVKITSEHGKSVYGKIIKYDCPYKKLVLSKSLIKKLDVSDHQIVTVEYEEPLQITKIMIETSRKIKNPLLILEFEFKNKTFLNKDDIIVAKIFDKKYEFKVVKLSSSDTDNIEIGIINNNIATDIDIDFEYSD